MECIRQIEAIHSVVERIVYDGTSRQVSIWLHPSGHEARA
jgi:hypothetical protein